MTDVQLPRNAELKKVPADSVPYGSSVCRRGESVWAVYVDGQLCAIGATAKEARRAYCRSYQGHAYGRPPMDYPGELEGRKDKPRRLLPGEEP